MQRDRTFEAQMAGRAIDDKVADLLYQWYAWERGYKAGRGHARVSATTADYRAPRHFDWKNGAADAKVEEIIARDVGAAVYAVPDEPHRWRTCVQREAYCIFWGIENWASPVLPQGEELKVLRMEARNKIIREFRIRGLLD